ncbi:hypothetical protein MMC31_006315 [Peltigera leucophlebia]|nr:hypothetical protein [Peltigera leucophlebia]
MSYGVFITFLGALPLIVANPLPADSIGWKDSDQLLSTYLDPNALSLVPNLGDQGSLPSISFDTSTHDSLESIAATTPGAVGTDVSTAVCENEEVQPGVKNNAKLRKRQGESCVSPYKKTQSPTIAPPKPIVLPDLGEQLLTLPPETDTEPDNNQCRKPFVNRFCCNGPFGKYMSSYSPLYPNGFYEEVDHCVYWTAEGCLSPANDFCCVDRETLAQQGDKPDFVGLNCVNFYLQG